MLPGAVPPALVGLLLVIAVVLALLWVALPLAVLSSRGLLRQLLREQRETNRLLSELRDRQR